MTMGITEPPAARQGQQEQKRMRLRRRRKQREMRAGLMGRAALSSFLLVGVTVGLLLLPSPSDARSANPSSSPPPASPFQQARSSSSSLHINLNTNTNTRQQQQQQQQQPWFSRLLPGAGSRRKNGDTTVPLEEEAEEEERNGELEEIIGADDDGGIGGLHGRVAVPEAVAAGLAALWQDKRRLGRWTASGLQVGLLLYLANSVWKALCEVLDEYSDLSDVSGSSSRTNLGAGGGFAKPRDVDRTLQFLEQSPETLAAVLDSMSDSSADKQSQQQQQQLLPPLPLLQLANNLVACGLPLRSTASSGFTTTTTTTSVESVLLQLTRPEAALLQQCLWVPPPVEGTLQDTWTQVAGLFQVKERLLGALTTLYRSRRTPTTTDDDRQQQELDFASLFEEGGATRTGSGGGGGSPVMAGILLYGPPGCGKTMLVRALATTSRVPCLVVTPSVLLRKYVGETNSQVRCLFSLAHKLAPCVLCIDELDGLFRERNDQEHEVSRDLKTEFLQWWDGMLTTTAGGSGGGKVLVIGATNRPFDVDSAVLRRLPQSHFVGLPDAATRSFLLKQLLRNVPTDSVDASQIALQTEGYSPSDLRQVLQTAALMGPMRDQARTSAAGDNDSPPLPSAAAVAVAPVRPLTTNDILQALQQTPPTPMSPNYRMALANFANLNIRPAALAAAAAAAADDVLATGGGGDKWETDYGNFYSVGTVEVDHHAFDTLHNFVQELDNLSDSDEEDEEEENDDFDDDEDV